MNTSFMLEFLQIFDEKLFNKKKTEFNSMKKPSKPYEILSTKGYVIMM